MGLTPPSIVMKLHGKCCVYVTRNSCGSIVDSFTYTEKLTDAAEIVLPNRISVSTTGSLIIVWFLRIVK